MGLLGNWLPEDPDKNAAARQGLLQAGAALMGGRGNLGEILGGGLMAGSQGYNGALQQQQQAALRQAQVQQTQLENKRLQAAADEPMQLQKILGGQAAPMGPPPGLPRIGGAPSAGAAPAPTGIAPTAPADQYSTLMGYADRLSQAGRPTQAKIYYDQAEKLRPKLMKQEARMVNGQRVMANVFEDGTTQQVDGFAPDAEKLSFQNTGGSTVALDPFTGKPVNTIQNTVSPDAVYGRGTQYGVQGMIDKRARESAAAGDQAPITDQAIVNAAARYNLDGTLPPMGMGKNAAAGRSAILNKAAELAAGIDPSQQRRDQITNKNDLASQGAAVKAFTSGKQGNTVRSFNVSLSHLDTLDQLADALHNGNAQAINKAGNYFATQTGNPAPTNFDAAKKVVADEVVKAIVGSGGGVHDREEAARVIAAANSPAQLKGVIGTYKELMRGQLHGLEQQYKTSTGREDFDKFLSPAAKVKDIKDLPKKTASAGLPTDISGLLNKYGGK